MPVDITDDRMKVLSKWGGTIGVEGDGEDTEIVVRIVMVPEDASDVYYELTRLW